MQVLARSNALLIPAWLPWRSDTTLSLQDGGMTTHSTVQGESVHHQKDEVSVVSLHSDLGQMSWGEGKH